MIDDLSRSLRAVLRDRRAAHELSAAQVSFEPPQPGFNPESDTVSFYLYDLRENVELRNNTPAVRRNGNRATQLRPPTRVDATYLVSIWSTRGEDSSLREQRLFGQLLAVFAGLPVLPKAILQGCLANQAYPVRLTLFPPAAAESAPLLWQALGLPLRPSLNLRTTFTLESAEELEGPVVTQANWRLGQTDPATPETVLAGSVEEHCSPGGRRTEAAREAVANAKVEVAK